MRAWLGMDYRTHSLKKQTAYMAVIFLMKKTGDDRSYNRLLNLTGMTGHKNMTGQCSVTCKPCLRVYGSGEGKNTRHLQIKLLDADGNPVAVETADCADCVKQRTPEEDLVPIIVGGAAGAAVLLILVILGRSMF